MKRSPLLFVGGIAVGAWVLTRAARSRYSFAGKVVIITGARGLALVIARYLADEGARLALLARNQDELARAKLELEERGATVLTVSCDLRERTQIDGAVRQVVSRFGGLDVLINNAGVIEVGPFEHMTQDDFERSLDVHFWAPFHLTMLARQEMKKRGGGRIVNISSIGGKIAVPHLVPYCAGKFALTGFSDSTRAELARENIFVTTVAPGLMRTGSHLNARFKGDHAAEFAWFALSNGLPLISISAQRAARKIVAACRRGQLSLTLTFAARFAIAGNALAPNLTGYTMKLVNRLLPARSSISGNQLRTGWESRTETVSRLTRHLEHATARNNEAG